MRDCLLTFDFGTSYFKAAVIDQAGAIISIHRTPAPIAASGDRSEIDPAIFRETISRAVHQLGQQCPGALERVAAVTFCTQANTFVLLDQAGRPLTPLIVWNDTRAAALARDDDSANSQEHRSITGIPFTNHYFAFRKLQWLARYEPQIFRAARKLLFIGDFFTHWLTGRHATDRGVAAISGIFDVRSDRWSQAWCDRLGVDIKWLPEVLGAGAIVGDVTDAAAKSLGIPSGCPLVMGTLDQYAGAIGVGNDRPGRISETTGTVLTTIRTADRFAVPTSGDVFVGPGPIKGTFLQMKLSDVSGGLLEYFRGLLPDAPTFEALDQLVDAPGDSLHLDQKLPIESLRSTIGDWTQSKPRGDVVRSIYRAVASAVCDQVNELVGEQAAPDCIRAAGGAARSRRWLQLKADTCNLPFLAPDSPEPALQGAAILAAPALGWPRPRRDDPSASLLVRPHTDRYCGPESGRR